MQNQQTQSLNAQPVLNDGPIEIDTQLLHLVSGGAGSAAPTAGELPLPKSGW
ncbi:MAG: hypothetical protein IV107_07115 [Paucibacter sp.]|nr:hypothetical protein [Roseateles sp.]